MTANPAIVPPAAVAVIGLGNMGVPMGACLIKAGFKVTGFDLSDAARGNFDAAGGRTTDGIRPVAIHQRAAPARGKAERGREKGLPSSARRSEIDGRVGERQQATASQGANPRMLLEIDANSRSTV